MFISTERHRLDARALLNVILWIVRSEAAWRDLPECYGAWQIACKQFVQWKERGLMEKVLHELSADADFETLCIDSTYPKMNKASAGFRQEVLENQNQSASQRNQCI